MTKQLTEKDIEAYFRDECKSRGWGCYKNISDPRRGGTPGFPDRTVVLPSGMVVFVELKSPKTINSYARRREDYYAGVDPKGTATEFRQWREQQKLFDLNAWVSVVGTYEQVNELMEMVECYL